MILSASCFATCSHGVTKLLGLVALPESIRRVPSCFIVVKFQIVFNIDIVLLNDPGCYVNTG